MPTREQIEKTYDTVLYGMTALRNNQKLWDWAMGIVASHEPGTKLSVFIDDDTEAEFANSFVMVCDTAAKSGGRPLELKDRPMLRALLQMLLQQLIDQLPGLIGGLFPPAEPTS